MKDLQEIANRRNCLLERLHDTENDLKLPGLRPKVRAGVQRLHLALTVAIQELELILGLRGSTIVDLSV